MSRGSHIRLYHTRAGSSSPSYSISILAAHHRLGDELPLDLAPECPHHGTGASETTGEVPFSPNRIGQSVCRHKVTAPIHHPRYRGQHVAPRQRSGQCLRRELGALKRELVSPSLSTLRCSTIRVITPPSTTPRPSSRGGRLWRNRGSLSRFHGHDTLLLFLLCHELKHRAEND